MMSPMTQGAGQGASGSAGKSTSKRTSKSAAGRRLAISIVLGLAMAGTSALTGALTPAPRAPLPHEQFSLEQMIPSRFGTWVLDPSVVPLRPDPEQQGMLEKIYDQTLSRTYIDPQGRRVMLSIAYGGDQSKSLQLHLPEVCYVAQGFEMLKDGDDLLPTRYGQVPVKRLVARLSERNEPITYWITIGDKATRSGIEQKLRRLAYGLSGEIPDGMLVRVSTIQANENAAWQVQDRFVADLLGALSPRDRAHLIGADTDKQPAAALPATSSATSARTSVTTSATTSAATFAATFAATSATTAATTSTVTPVSTAAAASPALAATASAATAAIASPTLAATASGAIAATTLPAIVVTASPATAPTASPTSLMQH
jgi:EpsI family protein